MIEVRGRANMKKLFVLIIAILLVLTFAGCGGGGSDDDPAGGGTDNGGGNGGNGGNGGGAGGGGGGVAYEGLCFTSTGYSSFRVTAEGGLDPVPSLEYSKDGSTWTALGTSPVALEPGDKVYLRGDNAEFSYNDSKYVHFIMSGSIAASGNIMSLVDSTCASLTIPNVFCFYNLFKDCAALTSAPELPATTLKSSCYGGMFKGCSNLTVAPALPAETLEAHCYEYMFNGCSVLNSIEVHFTDWKYGSPNFSTHEWVDGVPAAGDFYCPAGLVDRTEHISKVPAGWTMHDLP